MKSDTRLFGVIRRVWRVIKILRRNDRDEMAQLIFDIARRGNGMGNFLSQYRLIALPKSVKRLPDRIFGHA
jgi:predicted DNA-binding ribbon-helix-helix protein